MQSALDTDIRHTNTNHIELETSLQQLALDLLCDTVEANMTTWENGILHCGRHVEM